MYSWTEMTIEEKRTAIAGTWLMEDFKEAMNCEGEEEGDELNASVGNSMVRLLRAFKGQSDADLDEAVKEVDEASDEE